MPDVTFGKTKKRVKVHSVYIPDVILFIFPNYIAPRMQLFRNKNVKTKFTGIRVGMFYVADAALV